jgi:hypothetical protein
LRRQLFFFWGRVGVFICFFEKFAIFAQNLEEMNVQIAAKPLSNIQIELLKLYSTGVSEEDINAIRQMLGRFFMEKAVREASQVWVEKGYSQDVLLNEPS